MSLVQDLAKYVESSLEQGKDPARVAEQVVLLCNQRNLRGLLPVLIKRLRFMAGEAVRRETCLIETPYELSADIRSDIAAALELQDQGRIVESIDRELIAGVKIRYQGRIIDTSVRSLLDRMRTQLDQIVAA